MQLYNRMFLMLCMSLQKVHKVIYYLISTSLSCIFYQKIFAFYSNTNRQRRICHWFQKSRYLSKKLQIYLQLYLILFRDITAENNQPNVYSDINIYCKCFPFCHLYLLINYFSMTWQSLIIALLKLQCRLSYFFLVSRIKKICDLIV